MNVLGAKEEEKEFTENLQKKLLSIHNPLCILTRTSLAVYDDSSLSPLWKRRRGYLL